MRGLEYLLRVASIKSLLDVGAGTGTWLLAARRVGVGDVLGVDGVAPVDRHLWVDADLIQTVDLRQPMALDRNFDAAICLEVGEHLPSSAARVLVASLCLHSDLIFFSAAVPGQRGEAHVNCQWPVYWQGLFNDFGYSCADELRPLMWNDELVEPWYRQNIFVARRNPSGAGKEPRISALIHPEMLKYIDLDGVALENAKSIHYEDAKAAIEAGSLPAKWYIKTPYRALSHKLFRMLSRRRASARLPSRL